MSGCKNHELGIEAKTVIENASEKVAAFLGSTPHEIVFTSGGSESNNTVIKGVAHTYKNKGSHMITSNIEHPAIINPCKYLESIGYKISYVPVDQYGMVNPADVESVMTDRTVLVTIMHSNNETGTIQPIEEISKICRAHHVLLHTDASQSVGKVPIDVNEHRARS